MGKWLSKPPTSCDVCGDPIGETFYDMRTRSGPWACMCPRCAMVGPGVGRVGTGFGQKYERRPDGSYEKTAG